MKSVVLAVSFLIVSFLAGDLVLFGQDGGNSKTEGFFEAKLSKSRYVLYEPVVLHYKARLRKSDLKPSFSYDATISLLRDGKMMRMGLINRYSGVPPRPVSRSAGEERYNRLFQPAEITYESVHNIGRTAEFFPQPGKYRIQFFLLTSSGTRIPSETIDFTVEAPTGLNKDALEFLSDFEDPLEFRWIFEERNGIELLKVFVERFSHTVYGDVASRKLATIYFGKGEFEKARELFERLVDSKNPVIARDSSYAIQDVEGNIRTREMLKAKGEQTPPKPKP